MADATFLNRSNHAALVAALVRQMASVTRPARNSSISLLAHRGMSLYGALSQVLPCHGCARPSCSRLKYLVACTIFCAAAHDAGSVSIAPPKNERARSISLGGV